jgi:hypothetical protein
MPAVLAKVANLEKLDPDLLNALAHIPAVARALLSRAQFLIPENIGVTSWGRHRGISLEARARSNQSQAPVSRR